MKEEVLHAAKMSGLVQDGEGRGTFVLKSTSSSTTGEIEVAPSETKTSASPQPQSSAQVQEDPPLSTLRPVLSSASSTTSSAIVIDDGDDQDKASVSTEESGVGSAAANASSTAQRSTTLSPPSSAPAVSATNASATVPLTTTTVISTDALPAKAPLGINVGAGDKAKAAASLDKKPVKKGKSKPKPTAKPKPKASPAITGRRKHQGQHLSKRLEQSVAARHNSIKTIFIMQNRNVHDPKVQMIVDQRRTPTLDHLLDLIAPLLPSWGAVPVCRLHDATTGHPLTSIDALEQNQLYVACDHRKFKPMNYGNVVGYEQRQHKQKPGPKRKPQSTQHLADRPSIFSSSLPSTVSVLVVYNGDSSGKCTKAILKPADMQSFDKMLDFLSAKMASVLLRGGIQKLFTLNGDEVKTLDQVKDIKNGGIYVAMDKPPLKLPAVKFNGSTLIPTTPPAKLPALSKPKKPTRNPTRHPHAKGKGSGSTKQKEPTLPDYLAGANALFKQWCDDEVLDIVQAVAQEQLSLRTSVINSIAHTKLDRAQAQNPMFDNLIEPILNYCLHPDHEELWQTHDGDALSLFQNASIAASRGELDHWQVTPASLTSLLILLDQFPRQFSFDVADIYTFDSLALKIVLHARDESNVMDQMSPLQLLFICFVFSRQENMEYQMQCAELWERIENSLPPEYRGFGQSFGDNVRIIQEFGRFPGRNRLLGRDSTESERIYLGESKKPARPSLIRRLGFGSKVRRQSQTLLTSHASSSVPS
eukprot:m.359153 g.359153  ORF g.359153 m.359153 type:complete len:758 (+) comp18455_c0_seq1:225-2498(+)